MKRLMIATIAVCLLAPLGFADERVYGFVHATNGTPVANTTVSLYRPDGSLVAENATALEGDYNLSFDVGSGVYRIDFNTTSYQNATISKVILDNSVSEVNQTLQSLGPTFGTIRGTVLDAATNATIANASVLAQNGQVYVVLTNETGEYVLDAQPGSYNVTVSKAGYTDARTELSVIAGENSSFNASLLTTPPAMIFGMVRDSSGTPLNASVQVKQGGATIASLTSNATGSYTVTVTAGNYTIIISRTGYLDAQHNLMLDAGQTADVNSTLVPVGTVSGIIANGAGALVELKQAGTVKASTTVGENSTYAITTAAGVYDLIVTKSGYQTLTQSINLTQSGASFSGTLDPVATTTTTPSGGGSEGGLPPVTTTTTTLVPHVQVNNSIISITLPRINNVTTVALTEAGVLKALAITTAAPASASSLMIEELSAAEAPSLQRPVYRYLRINSTLQGQFSAALTFAVQKAWTDAERINVTTIRLERLEATGWTQLATALVSTEGDTYVFEATSPGFSLFAITGEPLPVQPTTSTTIASTTTTTTTTTIESTTTTVPATTTTTPAPTITGRVLAVLRSPLVVLLGIGVIMLLVYVWLRDRNRPVDLEKDENEDEDKGKKPRRRRR